MDDLLLQTKAELEPLLLEYGKLATRKFLTESEADRLAEILEQAITDPELHFWLTEIDHILGHQFGLLSQCDRQSFADQQALLREYLGTDIYSDPVTRVCSLEIPTNS